MSQQIATLEQLFSKNIKQIQSVLPKHITPQRLLRIATIEARKSPNLMKCTQESVLASVLQCAQLGFEPGGALGHAYLVPFKAECQFIMGYRGMIDLARRSGKIMSISAQVVRENDEFEFEYGLDEKLRHKPAVGERGEIIYAYAIAKLIGGGYQYEVMTKLDIDSVMNQSASYKFQGKASIWSKYYEEMARKTVIRRLFKYLPMSIEMASAVRADEAAESNEQGNYFDGEFELVPALKKSRSEKIIEKIEEQSVPVSDNKPESDSAITLEIVLETIGNCKSSSEVFETQELIDRLKAQDKITAERAFNSRIDVLDRQN